MYTSFDSLLNSLRKDEPNDYYNHIGAGFISGALYKSTGILWISKLKCVFSIIKDYIIIYWNNLNNLMLNNLLFLFLIIKKKNNIAGLKVATLSGGIFAGMVALCGLGTKAIKDTKEKIKEKKERY